MERALDIIIEKLKSTAMDETEINHLLARFLEEEAFDYVDYIETELKSRKHNNGGTRLLS